MLTEDEEVQEEENLMTDMFRCRDAGSNGDSTSSDDETNSSTSEPKKKKKKTTGKKGKKSKASKKKSKKQKKSKKSKKSKKDEDESEDPEKALITDLEKKIRKATGDCITWWLNVFLPKLDNLMDMIFPVDRQSLTLPRRSRAAMWS